MDKNHNFFLKIILRSLFQNVGEFKVILNKKINKEWKNISVGESTLLPKVQAFKYWWFFS